MKEVPDGIDWGDVFERLCAYGMGRMRLNPADAEQVAQETLRRFLDPAYASWDRAKEPNLLRHLGSIFNGIVRDMRTKKGFNRERTSSDGVQPDADDPTPSQGDRFILADQGRRAVARLLELATGKDLVQSVIALMTQEIDRPAEQAQRLGVPVARVYEARRTLAELVDVVRVELDVEV